MTYHVAFWYISVPSKQRSDCPKTTRNPDKRDFQQSHAVSEWFGRQALNDDIVTIEGDHRHRPNWDASEERTGLGGIFDLNLRCCQMSLTYHAVQFTHQRSEHPRFVIAVVHHRWSHCKHYQKIRDSQVDDNEIRRGTKRLCLCEDVNHAEIAKKCNHRKQSNGETQDWVPKGLRRGNVRYLHRKMI